MAVLHKLTLGTSNSLRYLCDQVVPGNRVTIMGIYSIKKSAPTKARGGEKGAGVGIRASYLRVVGIHLDTEGAGRDTGSTGCDAYCCKHTSRLFSGFYYALL